jgi:hypothetical protein
MDKRLRSIEVREASFEDYSQIVQLQSRHGLAEKNTLHEWRHLWVDNPVYRQLSKTWPVGWVLEDRNRKIAGYIGNIPLSYEFKGERLLAATGRAWVVDAQYRGYSLLLMNRFLAQTSVDLYINTTLNALAFEGFRLFGALPVPVGDWDVSRFWVTNPAGFLTSSLAVKGIPLVKPLSYFFAVPLLVNDHLNRWRFIRNERRADVQFCSGFDERFDAFWEELRRKRSHVLMGARSREVLDWHFGPALSANRVWIFCVADGRRLLAYSIFCRQDNELRRIRLADFQSLTDDNSLLLPMLSCAVKRCRRMGINVLEIIGLRAEKAELIQTLSPYRRKLPSWRSFYKARDPQLAESLKNWNVWDPSLFDGDSSL